MTKKEDEQALISPAVKPSQNFENSREAVAHLIVLYQEAAEFLCEKFVSVLGNGESRNRYRAYYPEVRITTNSYASVDSRLSFGHVTGAGKFAATITRPSMFRQYLEQQIGLLIENHKVPIEIAYSDTPIPIHFAIANDPDLVVPPEAAGFTLRDVFDVPDLNTLNDDIVNGVVVTKADGHMPLAPFSAQRVDYSLARLAHYTATSPEHFQNHVLFTNYQFYVEEFEAFSRQQLDDPSSGYFSLVGTGNHSIENGSEFLEGSDKIPQMPTYHLKRADGSGISLVNIGVGPSNAKTATDHIAVLRPHAWLMVGHCAGLRNSQDLGDFVLAHAYLREDHVLDEDVPIWVPIPALAEIQTSLEQAVAEITEYSGYDLKKIMRTGTVATIDNRNWELKDQSGPVLRLSQSRAIALDMESATIAANGYRFRVPYGTLLCVSDKPLHGELKLPGMATDFYKTQVTRHLRIGIRAMEILREMPLESIHSRKLRSFQETAFL